MLQQLDTAVITGYAQCLLHPSEYEREDMLSKAGAKQ